MSVRGQLTIIHIFPNMKGKSDDMSGIATFSQKRRKKNRTKPKSHLQAQMDTKAEVKRSV